MSAVRGGDAFWVGGYATPTAASAVHLVRRDHAGHWSAVQQVATADRPSYLLEHPHHPVLYAVTELVRAGTSALLAFAVRDGRLTRLAAVEVPAVPCHLALTADWRTLLSASYEAGTVNTTPLDDAGRFTGAVHTVAGHGRGPRPDRQDAPHAHAVAVAPDATVLSTDLGADLLRAHRLDEDGVPTSVSDVALPAGSGPRHLVVHPGGEVYVLTELGHTVVRLRPRAGYSDLVVVDESPATVRASGPDSLCSAIRLGPGGRFLYTATRGADVLTTHRVGADGAVHPVADTPCAGRWPRDFVVAGDQLLVAHEQSDSVTTFDLDPESGVPGPPGPTVPVPGPACLLRAR